MIYMIHILIFVDSEKLENKYLKNKCSKNLHSYK